MSGVFVTGTDTGVGKTYFSSALLGYLNSLGIGAVGFKPVETGCSPECSDAKELAESCGTYLQPVYSFKEPLAPAVAAELEGVEIEEERVISACRKLLNSNSFVLIEGAGGIMVPITYNFSYLDLVKALSLPVIIVALNKLGVINHTLLTFLACYNREVEVKAVVLNSFRREDRSFDTNLSTLKRLLSVPVLPFSSPSDVSLIAAKLLS